MQLPNLRKSVGVLIGMMLVLGGSLIIISPAPVQAACASLPSDKGQATFSVSIPTAGTYRVWTRLYPATTGNGKIQMQVDQAYCNILIGQNSSLPANQFTWVDYGASSTSKINLSLPAGAHVITLAGVDPSVGVDKIMFVTDAACTPTGFGTNCSPAATATPIPGGQTTPQPTITSSPRPTATPTPGPTQVVIRPGNSTTPVVVSGKITLTPEVPTSRPVTYLVDNQPLAGDSLDTTKLTDGDHVIERITTDSNGKPTITKQTIKVENGWQYQLVRGVQGHWQVISGIVLLLIVVGAGIVYFLTHRFLRPTAGSDAPSDNMAIVNSSPEISAAPMPPNHLLEHPDSPASSDSNPPNKA
jgi:hypothetical protein